MPTKDNTLIAPRRGDSIVDGKGSPTFQTIRFFEKIALRMNTDYASLDELIDRVTDNEAAIEELEPQYIVIDNSDSPYAAANNDYILADMSAGDVDITLPADGRLAVSRSGSSNTLTLIGTVEGETDPEIIGDGDAPSLAYIGTEWRYV